MTTLLIIACSVAAIYLLGVLRIYSLSLYYREFDETRKYVFLVPLNIIQIILYIIHEKKDTEVIKGIVFHFPTFYKAVGLQLCLLRKKISNKSQDLSENFSRQEIFCNIEQILLSKEKIICE